MMDIPQPLVDRYRESSSGRAWLKKLPRLIDAACERWSLVVDTDAMTSSTEGEEATTPWTGYSGIAIPVRAAESDADRLAVLKISYPHDGLAVDHEALRLWDTPGVVKLIDLDIPHHAFLMERLDGHRSLTDLPMNDAVAVWGEVSQAVAIDTRSIDWTSSELELLDKIPRQGDVATGLLRDISERWERLEHPLEPWLYQHAVDFLGGWLREGGRSDALINTDMHFENILARREGDPLAPGWVMIDPQVLIGEPEFSLAPLLWNRIAEYESADPVADVQARAARFAAAAGFDLDLALKWSVVRNLDNALEEIDEAQTRAANARGSDSDQSRRMSQWAERSVWVAAASMGRLHPGLGEHTPFPPL